MEPRDDYFWTTERDPHTARAAAIRAAHPEVVRLMGPEPLTKWVAAAVVALQVASAVAARDLPVAWFVAACYVCSATCQAHLFLAVHEVSHNLAFRSLAANRALAMVCNLPLVVPYCVVFKPFHLAHHKHLGQLGVDTDVPTRWEARLTRWRAGRLAWVALQLLAYALRPCIVKPELVRYNGLLACNWAACLAFDALIWCIYGAWPIVYMLVGMLFAASIHPTAGHFIAEHYAEDGSAETFSYYGPWNALMYNVGYHVEHHDFPGIAWTRLPELRRIAPESYDHLPQTASWPGATWRYLTGHMCGFNRVVRST